MTTQDLYALLGVDRSVDADGLRWAYERKLAEASRLGALRRAQEIDHAYTVLREPGRRALYDRHGVTTSVGREHPLQRWAPPKAVPFRAWSPPEETRRAAPVSCARHGRRWIALSFAVLGATAWGVSAFGYLTAGSEPAPPRTVHVVCAATPAGPGYAYDVVVGQAMTCSNGAQAQLGQAGQ